MPMGRSTLRIPTSSTKKIVGAASELYDRIVNPELLIRRLTITANRVVDADTIKQEKRYEQLDLFGLHSAASQKGAGKGRAGTGKEDAGSHAAYQEKVREKRDPERDESGGRRDGQRQKFADWRA